MKNKQQEKWLGDQIHEGGNSRSVLVTVQERRGRVTAAIFEVKAVIEDLRMQVIGGFVGGLDLWEMAIIPMLLNNADMWTEISAEAVKELDKLQDLFLSVMFCVPHSTPRTLLCWDTATMCMMNRVKVKKLNLMVHVKNLDESALARQVYNEQVRQDWPGLVQEVREMCGDWRLEDVSKQWTEEPTKRQWKNKIKNAARENNEKILRRNLENYRKLEEFKDEDFCQKSYLKDMNLYDARVMFRIRAKMIKCKMNFSSDRRNVASLWQCDSCMSNIDTQSHVLFCPAYSQLREGRSMKSDQDLVNYFKNVLEVREKLNLRR